MAEDFSAYTEVDPNTRIAVTSTRVTWTDITRDEDAYVYKDKTANYFDGGFTHEFTFRPIGGAHSGTSPCACWSVTNLVDDLRAIDVASGDYLALLVSMGLLGDQKIILEECDGGELHYSSYSSELTEGTSYYMRIIRDETVGTYGTLYCYVFTDSGRTTQHGSTLSITLHSPTKDFRYIFAFHSMDTDEASVTHSGYTENLALFKVPTPTVTTVSIHEILSTTATAWGDITSLGNAAVTEHGHCWSISANPTTSDNKTAKGTGSLGFFPSLVTGLSASTTYHIRAYATNSYGTSYGADKTFITTSTGAPAVTTGICSDITATTATGNGTITSVGSSAVTEHGHCWAIFLSPTTALDTKTTNGAGYYGAFTSAITGLTEGTTYYIRAYATNTQGTAYGNNITLVAGGVSSETSGVTAVVRERFHYVSASGIEYYVQGVKV